MNYKVIGQGEAARLLARKLDGEAFRITEMPLAARRRLRRTPNLTIVNYGYGTAWAHVNAMGRNNRGVIKNKALASHAMLAANINGANYMNGRDAADILRREELDMLLQRTTKHSKGRDIVEVRDPALVRNDRWYVVPFPKDREYRVHIAFGHAFKIQRKHPNDQTQLVWSNDHSRFERVSIDNPAYTTMCEESVQAVAALGLDFGAVDVGSRGWNKRRGPEELIVFEVNTAPALNDHTAEAYAAEIRRHCE